MKILIQPKNEAVMKLIHKKITEFKSVIGLMLFVGRLTHPILLRTASHMATKTNKLLFHHLKDLYALAKYAKKYKSKITFKNPNFEK